ncbi:MAG TPA: hypothetical protein VIJ94_02210 [Caulobacteraceae bacterium]
MTDASDLLPSGFTPVEEAMFEKAQCRDCGAKIFEDVRQWAHEHVRATGHAVHLYFGYDVRDEHWESRLSYERVAEIEQLRGAANRPG